MKRSLEYSNCETEISILTVFSVDLIAQLPDDGRIKRFVFKQNLLK